MPEKAILQKCVNVAQHIPHKFEAFFMGLRFNFVSRIYLINIAHGDIGLSSLLILGLGFQLGLAVLVHL